MKIQFLYFEDCLSHEEGLERLKQVIAEERVSATVEVIKVETDAQAQQLRFAGSPTILINGVDIDPPGRDAFFALTCRAYYLETGRVSPLPSSDMIRKALITSI